MTKMTVAMLAVTMAVSCPAGAPAVAGAGDSGIDVPRARAVVAQGRVDGMRVKIEEGIKSGDQIVSACNGVIACAAVGGGKCFGKSMNVLTQAFGRGARSSRALSSGIGSLSDEAREYVKPALGDWMNQTLQAITGFMVMTQAFEGVDESSLTEQDSAASANMGKAFLDYMAATGQATVKLKEAYGEEFIAPLMRSLQLLAENLGGAE